MFRWNKIILFQFNISMFDNSKQIERFCPVPKFLTEIVELKI